MRILLILLTFASLNSFAGEKDGGGGNVGEFLETIRSREELIYKVSFIQTYRGKKLGEKAFSVRNNLVREIDQVDDQHLLHIYPYLNFELKKSLWGISDKKIRSISLKDKCAKNDDLCLGVYDSQDWLFESDSLETELLTRLMGRSLKTRIDKAVRTVIYGGTAYSDTELKVSCVRRFFIEGSDPRVEFWKKCMTERSCISSPRLETNIFGECL